MVDPRARLDGLRHLVWQEQLKCSYPLGPATRVASSDTGLRACNGIALAFAFSTVNAKQAKEIHQYKNLKVKLQD